VLAGCCIVGIFGVTSLYGSTFGLMMLPMQKELGWSRGDITFVLTLMTLVGPAILPLVGWVIDHVRLRPLILWRCNRRASPASASCTAASGSTTA
jgi:hypothetical protein